MSNDQQPKETRLGWQEIFLRTLSLIREGELDQAILDIDAFISVEVDPEERSSALGFRAHIEDLLGNAEAAESNLLTARSLTRLTYTKYVHEISLGSLFERQDLIEEACTWYRTALNTCLLDNTTSGGTVLHRLLQLRPAASLSDDDIALCRRVIEHSWQVLRLSGMPDLLDLELATSIIRDAQSRPLPGSK